MLDSKLEAKWLSKKACEGQRWKEGGGFTPCPEQAVTWRKDFRWGDASKGEKLVVEQHFRKVVSISGVTGSIVRLPRTKIHRKVTGSAPAPCARK